MPATQDTPLGSDPLLALTEVILRAKAARDLLHGAARPFILGVTGSVAAGKTTIARTLAERLGGHVETLTTDGFLYSNAELEARGLLECKGFPPSYDAPKLRAALEAFKSGAATVATPIYSHEVYDILTEQERIIPAPQVLILEGINILQATGDLPLVSDFIDFSIYVDAAEEDLLHWFDSRFMKLREAARADETSFFRKFLALSDDETHALARKVWDEVNGLNLKTHILPTKTRADLVLTKARDHSIARLALRQK